MTYSYIIHLECPKCQTTYTDQEEQHLCECGSPLLVRYNMEEAAKTFKKRESH